MKNFRKGLLTALLTTALAHPGLAVSSDGTDPLNQVVHIAPGVTALHDPAPTEEPQFEKIDCAVICNNFDVSLLKLPIS